MWGATGVPRALVKPIVMFQSTRPCGARRARFGTGSGGRRFQSTRPCGARHEVLGSKSDTAIVSIHAPVWGATGAGKTFVIDDVLVSIHAPVWGAT